MNAICLLTRVSTTPSKRVLKKALLLAHSFNQPLKLYAEDYRRSEDHTFLDFLLQGEGNSVRYNDYYVQWCSSILELIEDINSELELLPVEVDFVHLPGSQWLKGLTDESTGASKLLCIDYASGVMSPQVLRELTRHRFDVLLMTGQSWKSDLRIAVAIDPLHRQDKEADVDQLLVKRSQVLKEALDAEMSLVYCQYVAPYLYKYTKEILDNQKFAIQEFLVEKKLHQVGLTFVKGNPEQGLPKAVNVLKASILVMGACKRGALSRYWAGSTVDVLLKEPPCDLLLVGSHID